MTPACRLSSVALAASRATIYFLWYFMCSPNSNSFPFLLLFFPSSFILITSSQLHLAKYCFLNFSAEDISSQNILIFFCYVPRCQTTQSLLFQILHFTLIFHLVLFWVIKLDFKETEAKDHICLILPKCPAFRVINSE